MILSETFTMSNGVTIPKLGLGTWFIDDDKVAQAVRNAVKIGYLNRAGWAAYLSGSVLFVKRWTPDPEAEHVDFGCNCESYCNDRFIEVETLGSFAPVDPGQSVTHVEEWELYGAEGIPHTLDGIRELIKRLGLM